MLAMVVVMAIVLLLVARQWRSVAPVAQQVSGAPAAFDDRGETGAGEAVRSGELPDLKEMQAETSAHADQLEQALEQTE